MHAGYEGYANDAYTVPSGPWSNHRSTVQFTGDTYSTWQTLSFEAAFTTTEGNIGQPYVTHDLGGFHGNHLADDLYVRWVQLGTFQPIFVCTRIMATACPGITMIRRAFPLNNSCVCARP